jgi:isopropylmalate/homocitrate/citramalate synthase
MKYSNLIYDWNNALPRTVPTACPVLVDDESLRDGLQSPSVRDPSIGEKIEILHLMEGLSINMLDVGLPGAGPRAVEHVEALAREIVRGRMNIQANAAARTHQNDIRPIAEIVQRTGLPIEVAMFLGSSPVRRYVEGWSDDFLLTTTENAIKFAVANGLEVMYVTEDTTRCDPETIKRLYRTAIDCGARAITLADTCGHATPMGAYALTKFVREQVIEPSGRKIRLDWHGHCDRGFGLANAIAAFVAGADCIHGCANGIGERVGNVPMDLLLVNFKLMGIQPWADQDLSRLKDYCLAISAATGIPIPKNYPVLGDDAFRTATGVHAAAVIKAFKKGDQELADTIYSGVPARYFGFEQVIEIGPMSGKSNVTFWLDRHGVAYDDELVERIFSRAKSGDRVLTESEIVEICEECGRERDRQPATPPLPPLKEAA